MTVPLRLLLVEDSEDDAELVCLELAKADFDLDWRRVDTEHDFVTALAEPWDVIISDFRMPNFNGLRAFELYQEKGIDTPFIFVSGALGEERAVEAMRIGARDYLLKGDLARLNVAVQRELGEARNRSAQRQAEETARRDQRRLAAAVEASGAGIFEYSVPVGPDTHFSERWAEILGYTVDELPPREEIFEWLSTRVNPDDLPRFRQLHDDFLAGRSERYAIEMQVRHKAGHVLDVALMANAVESMPDRWAPHVVGVMLDLTERRMLETQLRQAQKMEAIGRLAGGVAHDFNNLLTAIFGFGEFILNELEEGAPAHQDMQELLKAASRAETLTGQLLAFSRRKPVSPKVLSINTVVEDMDRMLRRIVGEDVDVATVLAPDLWNVRIDPGSLEQVIVNIAVNARDAMPEGGKLSIETQNVELDESYAQSRRVSVEAGAYAVVAISDDGTGMDEATRRNIFEPFFTTKDAGKGTGLGLSTCYGIVKQAAGYIWVYSEIGKGTTFKIYLPRVLEQPEQARQTLRPDSMQGSETILLAEDDEQLRTLAVRTLSRLGYRVLAASNGKEALREYETAGVPIDLLLTDVVMPEMSGKQLAESLLSQLPGLKVVYMSGYTSHAAVHHGMLEAGSQVLQKPFTPAILARTLREVLDAK